MNDNDLRQAIEDLGLGGPPAQWKRVYYEYILNFNTTITAGSAGTATQQINQGGAFVCQAIKGAVYIPADNTAVAYTPFYHRISENTIADLTWESLLSCTLDLRTVDTNWFSAPILCNLIMGDALNPFILPTTRPIAANDEITATLQNNSGESIRGQVCLCGHKLMRR